MRDSTDNAMTQKLGSPTSGCNRQPNLDVFGDLVDVVLYGVGVFLLTGFPYILYQRFHYPQVEHLLWMSAPCLLMAVIGWLRSGRWRVAYACIGVGFIVFGLFQRAHIFPVQINSPWIETICYEGSWLLGTLFLIIAFGYGMISHPAVSRWIQVVPLVVSLMLFMLLLLVR